MADPIVLRFHRPPTPREMEFHSLRMRLKADPKVLLVQAPGFFTAFAEQFRNVGGCLFWAGVAYGIGNIHSNLEFLFFITGYFLFACVFTFGRVFESLENFGDLRDKHRAYYQELADDLIACSDYESFHELREGKEAQRLYR